MTQKTSLKPIFALAFLASSIIICCLLIFGTTVFSGVYAMQSFNPPKAIVSPTKVQTTNTPAEKATSLSSATNEPTSTAELHTSTQISGTPEVKNSPTATVLPTGLPTATPSMIPTEFVVPTPSPSSTPSPIPSPVASATENVLPTVDPRSIVSTQSAKATADTQDMVGVIAKLYTDGILHSTSGTFHSLPSFEGDWNDTTTYQKTDSGYNLSNFIVKADAAWEVDGLQGNWSESGCGVIFREIDNDNYYLVYWSLDGRARLMRKMSSGLVLLGRSTIFDVDRNSGKAQVMVVAEEDWIRIYIDGIQKFEKRGDIRPGKLEFTIISGNNKGYGTYCRMSNIGLWEIK